MNSNLSSANEGKINYNKILNLFLSKWYIYLITGIVAFLVAFYINSSTTEIYEVTTTILIKEQDQRRYSPEDIMSTMNMFSPFLNFKNEILVLKSTTLLKEIYTDLNLNVSCYSEGLSSKELYKDSPFVVTYEAGYPQPLGIKFYLVYLGGNSFRLKAEGENIPLYSFNDRKTISFIESLTIDETITNGEVFESNGLRFTVIFDHPENTLVKKQKFSFTFQSDEMFARNLKLMLDIKAEDPEATAAIITLQTGNPELGSDILDRLGSNYLLRDLQNKKYIAKKTIDYIDSQLNIISDSLARAEKDIEKFRVTYNVMDVQQKSGFTQTQMDELQQELAQIEVKIKYYDYIQEYFEQNKEISDLIAPSSVGIEDPLLNNLMQELITLHTEKNSMIENNQEKNPYLSKINIRINNLKNIISENIKYIKNTLAISRNDITDRIELLDKEISDLPFTQRKLLGMERGFRLNDEIYTYLMQRRSEASIGEASTLPRNEIIEPASLTQTDPVLPKKGQNYIFAIFLAGVFSTVLIFFTDPARNNINTREELSGLTDYPILGKVLHNGTKKDLVMAEMPNSGVSESFRSIYSNLQFFKYGKEQQTLLVTSSFGSEGKSFFASNLALTFAQFGHKTVVLEFDLRKPNISKKFSTDNSQGISNFLSNSTLLADIIQNTPVPNLDVIPAGMIPPNPAELTASSKSEELIKALRNSYEILIIDAPPVGIVMDAMHLLRYSDLCLYLVRERYTHRGEFTHVIDELRSRDIQNIALVLNDHKVTRSSRYGYGYYEMKKKTVK